MSNKLKILITYTVNSWIRIKFVNIPIESTQRYECAKYSNVCTAAVCKYVLIEQNITLHKCIRKNVIAYYSGHYKKDYLDKIGSVLGF